MHQVNKEKEKVRDRARFKIDLLVTKAEYGRLFRFGRSQATEGGDAKIGSSIHSEGGRAISDS
jgi:hypothetical protein